MLGYRLQNCPKKLKFSPPSNELPTIVLIKCQADVAVQETMSKIETMLGYLLQNSPQNLKFSLPNSLQTLNTKIYVSNEQQRINSPTLTLEETLREVPCNGRISIRGLVFSIGNASKEN